MTQLLLEETVILFLCFAIAFVGLMLGCRLKLDLLLYYLI